MFLKTFFGHSVQVFTTSGTESESYFAQFDAQNEAFTAQ